MRRYGILAGLGVLSIVAAAVGCGANDGAAPEAETALETQSHALDETNPTCPGLRWVGEDDGIGPCEPAGAKWDVSRVFPGATAPALKKFCLYEWNDPSATPTKGTLPGGGAELSEDCFTNTFQGNAALIEDKLRPTLVQAHRIQLESPTYKVQSPPSPTNVSVAILDTWPAPGTVGRSEHGVAMAGIVEAVACGNLAAVPCPVTTTPFLALDRWGTNFEQDLDDGGTYGSVARLARMVFDAVPSLDTKRVIINLSVGVDDRHHPTTGPQSRALRTLRKVLEWAACKPNVIVIASAGNSTAGPEPGKRPVLPAAWEKVAAPCSGPTRPILWSAGGVDGFDLPIPNSRPEGRPVLAAPSFAVPSSRSINPGQTHHSGVIVGTSASSAVLSGIAALVWHQNGSLPPAEVMKRIRDSATELYDDADYCLLPPCGKVKRVSVCGALAAAKGKMCGAYVDVPKGEGTNPVYSLQTLAAVASVYHEWGDGTQLLQSFQHPQCDDPVWTLSGQPPPLGPKQACASEVMTSDLFIPSVDPQPPIIPCPACFAYFMDQGDSWFIDMAITERIDAGIEVVPQTVTLLLRGDAVERFDLGSVEDESGILLRNGLTPGSTYRIEMPGTQNEYGVEFDAISIEWTRTDAFTTSYLVVNGLSIAP